jgi:hypothetical protein
MFNLPNVLGVDTRVRVVTITNLRAPLLKALPVLLLDNVKPPVCNKNVKALALSTQNSKTLEKFYFLHI